MIRKNVFALRDPRPLLIAGTALLFGAAALLAFAARAQEADEIVSPALDPAALEELVAPVALYPDDVLGIVLPASTFPLQIVQASRFLDDLENDPTLQPDTDWDDSIIALLNYPEVLRMMNDDLDWTWALGEAVLDDQSAVLAAAQTFRQRAYAAGNLTTDDRQVVTDTEHTIVIEPADPKVVYIPYYDPREVIVYHRRPVYYYYPVAYPLYYYPYPVGYSFSTGFFFGVTSWFAVGWDSHFVHVHHHTNYLHPYYLDTHYYYRPYYYRNDVHVTVHVNNYSDVWQPSPRHVGARPQTSTVSGRTSTVRTRRTATVETQPGVVTRQSTTPRATATANTKLAPAARDASGRAIEQQTSPRSTRTGQNDESRRSSVGQGARASTSNRASGTELAAPSQPTEIARPSDRSGGTPTRIGGTAAARTSDRPSTVTGVSQAQIRSVRTTAGTAAPAATPTPRAAQSESRSTATPRTTATVRTQNPSGSSSTARTQSAAPVVRHSATPRASVAAPPTRAPAPAPQSSVSTPRSTSSSFSAPATSSPAPRATVGSSSSSRSTSSSNSSRRR